MSGSTDFRWNRALAIARKEIFHIARDRFTLAMALVLPVIVVAIFGVAIEFNLQSIPTGYIDHDRSASSRALTEVFGSSDYFRMRPVGSPAEGYGLVESERIKSLVLIPPGFERDLFSGRGADVQVIVDAADNAAASSVLSYLGDIQQRSTHRILEAPARRESVRVKTRFLFNPELNSKWFVVPGLIAVIMSILAVLLTALTVAREWESGSMELLLSTPVRPLEVILGKLSPYAVLGLVAVAIVYVMARVVFHVPFEGNHFVFLAGCLLFLVTYLAQGLLISIATRKQTLAMQIAMLTALLPSQLLSGFIFPVESMPVFFRYLTMVLPARWFMNIVRQSFLQGASLWDMRHSFLALAVIALVFISAAVSRFKKDVEP